MKRNILILGFFIVVLIFLAFIFGVNKIQESTNTLMDQEISPNKQTPDQTKGPIRRAAVAGTFYPANRNELQAMVNKFLENVGEWEATGTPRIIIVPHAGLVYSGGVAAYGYKAVRGLDYKTTILIGPSHTAYFEGVSIYPKGFYETPLGQVPIDEKVASRLIESDKKIKYYPQVHLSEHDLEVQLPFLQIVFPDFKIVPILMGAPTEENVATLASALKGVIDEKTLIVISSDLSHYPEYEAANEVDKKTIEAILNKNTSELDQVVSESMSAGYDNLDTGACGEEPIKVGMILAKELGLEGKLLKYANSGDVSGDYSRVVGYASIIFSNPKSEILSASWRTKQIPIRQLADKYQISKSDDNLLSKDKEELLKITRETLEGYLKDREIPQIFVESEDLQQHLGAFVTLRRKDTHELRGCIGRFSPTDIPLYQVVQQMAIAAATEDIRFVSVAYDELDDIEIEISVLSQLRKIDDWQEIELGKHGVEVAQGSRRGVFLPQVAAENNWDRETFMNELCEHKAGISRDAWKTGEAEIYVFTAEVFGEE